MAGLPECAVFADVVGSVGDLLLLADAEGREHHKTNQNGLKYEINDIRGQQRGQL